MASTKKYRDFILEQLRKLNVTSKTMYVVSDVDNEDTLIQIVLDTYEGLK